MILFYCPDCDDDTITHIEYREETTQIKGEEITVSAPARICDVCKNAIYDEEIDPESQRQAFDAYRRRHDIISPQEIRQLRETYGLTQQQLTQLLGWGGVSIHRYERGSIPDEAHNQVLRFIQNPINLFDLARRNGERLAPELRQRILRRLTQIIQEEMPERMRSILDDPRSVSEEIAG